MRTSRESGEAVEELLSRVETEPGPAAALEPGPPGGRVAVVTGGSSGIGRATVVALAQSGANVAFNHQDTGEASRWLAEETCEMLQDTGVGVFARATDIRDPEEASAFIAEAHDRKIVNVSSVHGLSSEFGLANYCSSKAGMIGFTRSAALELGSANVNVNAVAPGYIRTTQLTERVPAEILDRARERSVLGRLGDPQDVASVILFLCSEASRHITGAVIPVDGGYLI